jgi:hypothetical protein
LHVENCLNPYTATLAAIPNKDSFILRLYVGSEVVRVLLDSGASDCFISPEFIRNNLITPSPLSIPISLRLFNGSLQSKPITDDVELTLSSGDGVPRVSTRFLVSPLDAACDAVLGLNWLTETNPKINWATRSVAWTPIPDYKTALLRAVLTHDTPDDPLLIPDDEDETHPDPLKFVPSHYHDFADVFSKTSTLQLPPSRPFDHAIELEDGATPGYGPIYSISEPERNALKEFIDDHLATGTIRPSQSPIGSPVLFVKKKDRSLRMVVDYRRLNTATRKDRYPLPHINDLLERLGKASVFTKIDLRNAYHLLRIRDGDEWKTAFRTRYGSFEFLVMPFGLTNAPSSFQRFMNTIFGDLLDVSLVVYLDDLLIFSASRGEHQDHVREVLHRLQKHGLYAKPEKCEWEQDTVEFLGYHCSADGLRMDGGKIQVILDWPEPRNVRDVQSFLGFANFYRRFITRYSDIVVPLTRLLRKDTPWSFDTQCKSAFNTLKLAFTTAPVLSHWIPDVPQIIETDASDYAIAAIHSIRTSDGELHPVAFHSRTLGPAERNYDTHDKELLAIHEAFKIWRHHLEGSALPIDVFTDHKNLEYFTSSKTLTRRQARWSEYLNAFNLSLHFRPGKLGAKPDALTRRRDVYLKEGGVTYAEANPENTRPLFTPNHIHHTAESASQPVASTPSHAPIESSLRAGALVPSAPSTLLDMEALRSDILYGLTSDAEAQARLETLPHDPGPDSRWSRSNTGFLLHDGVVYVPNIGDLRTRVLKSCHDHPLAGHPGQTKTLELVRQDYFWPKMRDDVTAFVKSCVTCGRVKARRHQPYGVLQQLPIPERPWHSLSMDFIEQLPPSLGYTAILVIVDRLTKQALFLPTTDEVTSEGVAQLYFENVFSKHGVPTHITSDRGTEFVSHFFRSLGTLLGIRLHFTSGYHPQADGQTERVNQTLEQYLRMHCNYQQDDWSRWLPIAEFAYNNAESAATGTTPFFANKGYHPALPTYPDRLSTSHAAHQLVTSLSDVHARLRDNLAITQERTQSSADAARTPAPPLTIGDKVFLRAEFIRTTRPSRKLADKYLGPFEIIGAAGPASFVLRLPDGMRRVHPVWHVSQLEPAHDNPFEGRTQPPPPPLEVEGEAEHEVASILDSKLDRRRKEPLVYLVKWTGYEGTPDESSWEPAVHLQHAPDLVHEFHRQYPDKPGPM